MAAPAVSHCPMLHTQGSDIVTADGKRILLKGLALGNNAWGNWVPGRSEALQAQGEDPMIRPLVQDAWVLTDEDFDRLGRLGLNCVRYTFNYQLFAADNPRRAENLEKLRAHIERFAALDIYTVLNCAMAPGLDTQNDSVEKGKPGSKRLRSVFEDEQRYQEWASMWRAVAQAVKKVPGLAGYEVINEPRMPSSQDGGAERFANSLMRVCKEIRQADPAHILFVPEQHSREADPGERYWDPKMGREVVDEGEQGVRWDQALHKVALPNVAYVFHFYEPWNFCAEGEGTYDAAALAASIQKRVDWAKANGPAPLIVTEYGVARVNSPEKRIAWLTLVQGIFDKQGISSTLWVYKGEIGSFTGVTRDFFPLWGEWVHQNDEASVMDGNVVFKPWAVGPAEKSGFKALAEGCYWKSGKLLSLSLLDDQSVLECLQNYWKAKKSQP